MLRVLWARQNIILSCSRYFADSIETDCEINIVLLFSSCKPIRRNNIQWLKIEWRHSHGIDLHYTQIIQIACHRPHPERYLQFYDCMTSTNRHLLLRVNTRCVCVYYIAKPEHYTNELQSYWFESEFELEILTAEKVQVHRQLLFFFLQSGSLNMSHKFRFHF